jgi:hypothetical protein
MLNSALSVAQQRLGCTEVDGMSISSQPDLEDGTCEDLLSHWHSKYRSITEADGMSISLQPILGNAAPIETPGAAPGSFDDERHDKLRTAQDEEASYLPVACASLRKQYNVDV